MKLLITMGLWLAAATVVAWLVLRHRGRVAMLADERIPRRLVRMVAVLLVMIGVTSDARAQREGGLFALQSPPAEAEGLRWSPPGEADYADRPAHPFTDQAAEDYARSHGGHGGWVRAKAMMTAFEAGKALDADALAWLNRVTAAERPAMSEALMKVILVHSGDADVADLPDEKITADDLLKALDDAERAGFYDGWLLGYLWRAAPAADERNAAALESLYERLERHGRMLTAITRARAELGPIYYQPWMSKAAPPRDYQPMHVPDGFARRVMHHFARATAGSWHDEATARLTAATDGQATVIRRGQRLRIEDGAPLTLRRLDMIQAPADHALTLRQQQTGLTLIIPPGRTVGPRDLPRYLDEASRKRIGTWTAAAAEGDRDAAVRLEWTLPLTHAAIREHLDQHEATPQANPLPTLRMLFDR